MKGFCGFQDFAHCSTDILEILLLLGETSSIRFFFLLKFFNFENYLSNAGFFL